MTVETQSVQVSTGERKSLRIASIFCCDHIIAGKAEALDSPAGSTGYTTFGMWFTLSLFVPFSVAKKCISSKKTVFLLRKLRFSAEFKKRISKCFRLESLKKLGLEEITSIVDLVKRFPMSIWLQKSASIQTRTSLLKFDDHIFCISQFRSHAEPLVVATLQIRR